MKFLTSYIWRPTYKYIINNKYNRIDVTKYINVGNLYRRIFGLPTCGLVIVTNQEIVFFLSHINIGTSTWGTLLYLIISMSQTKLRFHSYCKFT